MVPGVGWRRRQVGGRGPHSERGRRVRRESESEMGRAMTTVDVLICEVSRPGGPGASSEFDGDRLLAFHNGLFGPATELMHAALAAARAGDAVPTGQQDEVDMTGRVLERLLVELMADGLDSTYYNSADAEQVQRFLTEDLRRDSVYRLTCIDF